MSFTPSMSARRSIDVGKPEAGVAEWASRIKELQRQVDEDDEAEQRRLEEEIAQSRMKRLSRRGQMGRPESFEIASTPNTPGTPVTDVMRDEPKSPGERQQDQSDALRKLIGGGPPKESTSPRPRSPLPPRQNTTSTPSSQSRSEPMSLAAFMGGRATGPRLNRHPAQQDAHDPTQFEQRTHISAPHPVFGRGGVAMPGMATKTKPPITGSPVRTPEPKPTSSVLTSPVSTPSSFNAGRERRTSVPAVTQRYLAKLEEPAAPKASNGLSARDVPRSRTISTPTAKSPVQPPPIVSSLSSLPPTMESRRTTSPEPSSTAANPVNPSPPALARSPDPITPPSSRPTSFTSLRHTAADSAPRTPPSASTRSPVTTPGLSRPIQPTPKQSPYTAQVTTPAASPSAAFLRAPQQKPPTPSLSRLQGRGFVQNMVRTSLELESGASPPQESGSAGRAAGKKTSVLERWSAAAAPSTPPPPASPTRPVRKSFGADVSPTKTVPAIIRPFEAKSTRASASPFAGEEGTHTPARPNTTPPTTTTTTTTAKNMSPGSSNTLISYIKPMKTGDGGTPPRSKTPTSRPRTPVIHEPEADADEFGVARGVRSGTVSGRSGSGSSALPVADSRPLSHPTKDRAKKPRKGKGASSSTPSQAPEKDGRALTSAVSPVSMSKPAVAPTPAPSSLGVTSAPAIMAELSNDPRPTGTSPPVMRAPPQTQPSVVDRWAQQPIIGIKPMVHRKSYEQLGQGGPPPPPLKKTESNGIRRALPGMAHTSVQTPVEKPTLAPAPAPAPVPQPELKPAPKPEPPRAKSPAIRHSRIPSTGSRARVMDVAQAFQEEARRSPETTRSPSPESPKAELAQSPILRRQTSQPDAEAAAPTHLPPPPALEKRRSSYEKYAVFALPPLEEERTPSGTPAGTFAKMSVTPIADEDEEPETMATKVASRMEGFVETVVVDEPAQDERASGIVHFEFVDKPLPRLNVGALLKARMTPYKPPADVSTVSVDVMAVTGSTATPIDQERSPYVFYDTEVIAVIHRAKSKGTGLVTTQLWTWKGRKAHMGNPEERKLQELAKRYGTTMVPVNQYQEPSELLSVLGGRLAVRQGTRAHWSSDNTAMHLIRLHNGSILIDEHDLDVRNLCSAFSYCLTILDNVYVWHGRGARGEEREAAAAYARSLANDQKAVSVLTEGVDDDDEMFWMMLGEPEYANAHHWRWRPDVPSPHPRVWRVDAGTKEVAHHVPFVSAERALRSSVLVVDCVWEFFVLVGTEARGDRHNIRTALSLALAMSGGVASVRPFTPPVHVVVFPSQVPADLRLAVRDLDEVQLNDGGVPDHMNILPAVEALNHLSKMEWERTYLKDHEFLPLGVHPSNLP
ncbi:hypothetical protein PUNSTDRAFT_83145 [Punctularia strigosozonata HHB-11173 SS5]|uniref:uncharacterized protein n=1 Tax=Punctularia strigosozonata (strain HHB-11173) TaxID=741275 RepID=UPI0004416816|nr:uncharacterized protein PUNSTDRAFT_83145 [Punctularia strigosozonata HHB-11173 SS5]EIN11515.1 hypothetical protein PUNSTDRAFT_83145 [Punctularia strigosozonata HHB-11173 SS5]